MKSPKKKMMEVGDFNRSITMSDSKWLYTNFPSEKSEYIRVNNGKIVGTKLLREGLLIDLDIKGNVIGVEILK